LPGAIQAGRRQLCGNATAGGEHRKAVRPLRRYWMARVRTALLHRAHHTWGQDLPPPSVLLHRRKQDA